MVTLTFKPKQASKNLLLGLPDRARDVIVNRFGLGQSAQKRTLESIGQEYGITRERVRQIENFALNTIKKSPNYAEQIAIFDELGELITSLGGVISEDDLLEYLSADKGIQNCVNFLLVLGENFERKKEDQHFRHRWIVDHSVSQKVHQALHNLYQDLSQDDLITEDEIVDTFSKQLTGIPEHYVKDSEILRRLLGLSKVIGSNQLGEWGLSSAPNIKARGVRDYAYLVIRRHGSPLHFTEVAREITKIFDRPAHIATCHNELIKDKDRFVLVGRGLYGLAEWGYSNGVVRDVIIKMLKENGSMSKEELIEKILKERYVKENTVIVNLQNKKHFKRDARGNYVLA